MESASPAVVRLLEAILETVAVTRPHQPGHPRTRPDRLIADRGDDRHAVRVLMVQRGIEPIIPARANNRQVTYQDGRRLRRSRRRWIIERTTGWLDIFRRLTVRYDRLLQTYGGFFICLRAHHASQSFEMTSRYKSFLYPLLRCERVKGILDGAHCNDNAAGYSVDGPYGSDVS